MHQLPMTSIWRILLIREKWCKSSKIDHCLPHSVTVSQLTSASETSSQDFFCEKIVLKNSNQRQSLQINKKRQRKIRLSNSGTVQIVIVWCLKHVRLGIWDLVKSSERKKRNLNDGFIWRMIAANIFYCDSQIYVF